MVKEIKVANNTCIKTKQTGSKNVIFFKLHEKKKREVKEAKFFSDWIFKYLTIQNPSYRIVSFQNREENIYQTTIR